MEELQQKNRFIANYYNSEYQKKYIGSLIQFYNKKGKKGESKFKHIKYTNGLERIDKIKDEMMKLDKELRFINILINNKKDSLKYDYDKKKQLLEEFEKELNDINEYLLVVNDINNIEQQEIEKIQELVEIEIKLRGQYQELIKSRDKKLINDYLEIKNEYISKKNEIKDLRKNKLLTDTHLNHNFNLNMVDFLVPEIKVSQSSTKKKLVKKKKP
tara:strand:- start:195 stop:839 length:645 start_codon:yes stop_codon:yes gene_type:complete